MAISSLICVSACAGKAVVTGPAERTLRIGGDAYVISQITASTWSATAARSASELTASSSGRLALLAEIERLSGCKVTNSDFSRQTGQLDAQVACAGQLNN
jgi:hypothetical protein